MNESTGSARGISSAYASTHVLLWGVGIFLALLFAWAGRIILLLIFAGIILAIMLSATAAWVMRIIRTGRKIAFLVMMLVAATTSTLMLWLAGPNILDQFASLQNELPRAQLQLIVRINGHGWGRWILSQWSDYSQLSGSISYAIAQIGGFFASAASVIIGIVIIMLLGVYLTAAPEVYFSGLSRLVPNQYRSMLDACAAKASGAIRSWLFAQMLSMLVVGILITFGLWLIGVPLAFSLGIIAAIMTFIPNLGPILSVAPAALLAFAISPEKGLITVLLFVSVHLLEGNVITPLLQWRIVSLPPALTLVAQLALALFAGPLGFALAAPFTAAVLGIFEVVLTRREIATANI